MIEVIEALGDPMMSVVTERKMREWLKLAPEEQKARAFGLIEGV